MARWEVAEKVAVALLLPRRARRGATWFGRMGDIVQQPPLWAALAAGLAVGGKSRGRRAAVRGTVCYGVAAVVANVGIKPFVGRSRPPGAGEGRPGPVTSSFPSGHTATDLAFSLGVSQEIPVLFIPLTVATITAHWSMVRSRGHYPSDVFVGGVSHSGWRWRRENSGRRAAKPMELGRATSSTGRAMSEDEPSGLGGPKALRLGRRKSTRRGRIDRVPGHHGRPPGRCRRPPLGPV